MCCLFLALGYYLFFHSPGTTVYFLSFVLGLFSVVLFYFCNTSLVIYKLK